MINKYNYQSDIIAEMIVMDHHEKVVLGIAPRGGKTRIALEYLEKIIKQQKKNGNTNKHFIFTEGQTFLRSQWKDVCNWLKDNKKISFKFKEVKKVSDLNEDADVYILLPTIFVYTKNRDAIVERIKEMGAGQLIVDEAHNRYLASTFQNYILPIGWERQILLTGTPFVFNRLNQENPGEYYFISVPGAYLIENGIYANVKIDLVSSEYNFTDDDYTTGVGGHRELQPRAVHNEGTIKTLSNVRKKLGSKLKSFKKIMVLATNIEQAEQINNYFNSIGFQSVTSHSGDDLDSDMVHKFKSDPKIQVLVVVNRAGLGFDMPEMDLLLDLKGSYSPQVVMQYIMRVFTKHPQDKEKLFIRVAEPRLFEQDQLLLAFTLSLMNRKYFSRYTGTKNSMDTMDVNLRVRDGEPEDRESNEDRVRFIADYEPIDVFDHVNNIGKESDLYASTNIAALRKRLSVNYKSWPEFEVARDVARRAKYKNKREYQEKCKELGLPPRPHFTYALQGFVNYGDFLGTGRISTHSMTWPSFTDAKKLVRDAKVKDMRDYQKKKNKLSLPTGPQDIYKHLWTNWYDFLGTHKYSKYPLYSEAVNIVRDLGIKVSTDYDKIRKENNLPSSPSRVYGEDWKGWKEFLGTKKEKN